MLNTIKEILEYFDLISLLTEQNFVHQNINDINNLSEEEIIKETQKIAENAKFLNNIMMELSFYIILDANFRKEQQNNYLKEQKDLEDAKNKGIKLINQYIKENYNV